MKRPVVFVGLAGFAALMAALVVYSALRRRETELAKARAQTVEIVVAARTLGLGAKLEPGDVRMARWARDSVPPGAYSSVAAVAGSFTKRSFVENEPLVADQLFTGQKSAGVMPLLIPPGMRAMSVPVDEVSDIAGFVLPHARVDVLVALSGGSGGEKPFSKIVLQDVAVLAVAQEIEQQQDKPQLVKVVTLLVTPREAERLALASREGTLRLAMRNYNDQQVVVTSGVDVAGLLHGGLGTAPGTIRSQQGRRLARAAVKPRTVAVEVLRDGKSAESVSFTKNPGAGVAPPLWLPVAPKQATPAKAPGQARGGAPAPLAASSAPAPAKPVAMASSPPAAETAFNGPNAKTIDVP